MQYLTRQGGDALLQTANIQEMPYFSHSLNLKYKIKHSQKQPLPAPNASKSTFAELSWKSSGLLFL